MTVLDMFLIMANSEIADPKGRFNQKWKDEEAKEVARRYYGI